MHDPSMARAHQITLTLAALALLAGCRDDALSPSSAAALDGDWGPQTSFIGSHWTMHLHASGATLAGTGDYALEAGRSGTFTVTGTAGANAQVTLDFAYDYGAHEHFAGARTPLDVLHGELTRVVGTDTTSLEQDYYRRGTP